MGEGRRDHAEPQFELGVVALHARLRADGGGRTPDRRIEVVPNDQSLRTQDPTPATSFRCKPSGLQHPLIVSELEKIVLPLACREQLIWGGILEGRKFQGGDEGR